MPKKPDTALRRLSEVIALAEAEGQNTAVAILNIAALELQLKAANVTDEEFRAFSSGVQRQTPRCDPKRPWRIRPTDS
jgi:hypothetical protein